MARVALDLNRQADREKLKATWRRAGGLVPGEPNEGLVATLERSPPRLPDYDDSGWEVCDNIRESISKGLTFAWYRIAVEVPEAVDGVSLAGSRVLFEINADNYAEFWVDGQMDRLGGSAISGFNASQRVEVVAKAAPGTRHLIAVLVANGPLSEPRGGVYLRYATLAFETPG